eukprot:GILJ01007574.1.p1 GENE.GILJ01007574.1~~GILJ01007574.1.p1  ORF type:complete len:1186 (+),score=205.74 GILJ01007574.1:74-3559(+)
MSADYDGDDGMSSSSSESYGDATDARDLDEDVPMEEQMDKLRAFVDKHNTQLRQIQETINESLAEIWDLGTGRDPIGLDGEPKEYCVPLNELIKTENQVLNKVFIVFTAIASEIRELTQLAQNKFFGPLTMFGERPKSDTDETDGATDGQGEIYIGRILPLLGEVRQFSARANSLAINLVHQLAALYHHDFKLYATTFKEVYLTPAFESLANLLAVLISLDSVILENESLLSAWGCYKRTLKMAKGEPEKYKIEEAKLKELEKMVTRIDRTILSSSLFQNCISQEFEVPGVTETGPGLIEVRNNKIFMDRMDHFIRTEFERVAQDLGQPTETNQRGKLVGLFGLYALFRRLYPQQADAKLFRSLWTLQKKVPLLVIYSSVTWSISDFINTFAPLPSAKKLDPPDVNQFKQNHIKSVDESFPADVQVFYLQVSTWTVRMESNLASASSTDPARVLHTRAKLLINGLLLALQIHHAAANFNSLHLNLAVPVRSNSVRPLCQCVELLKAIQYTFHRKAAMIAECLPYMARQIAHKIERLIEPVKQRSEKLRQNEETKLDVLAAVTLVVKMLQGTFTAERREVLNLSLCVVQLKNMIKDADIEEIRYQLWKLELLNDWKTVLKDATDCSFLYWSSNVFVTAFFQDVYERPEEVHRLHYIMSAICDPAHLLGSAMHESDNSVFLAQYKEDVHSALKETLVRPLCIDIERELRLHIHSVLLDHTDRQNPLKENVKDLTKFLALRPLQMFDRSIDIKARVTHYLDMTFYNMTTMTPNDWKTYEEMRNLAREKYGLSLTEVHLPGQTLEQGLDVLEIMRNIHIFVSRYHYNLHNQIFIEVNKENKHLNTISIRQIANSIRTHGTGIMNTTVNFTYQFLVQKFYVFSQFLFDDHIKSKLIKDARFFKDNKDRLDNKYPFERAEGFNRDIRKLGSTEDGKSFLDKFREVVTEIGNALGYVRMVRSAGLHHCSNAIKFVPDLADIISFEENAKQGGLSAESVEAAKNLDRCVNTLSKNFAEGTDYFKMLIHVFVDVMRHPDNMHLKNFFLIVPPLTLNYVENILAGKEKLNKKTSKDAFFTDDGFAIGLAYILKLLDQNQNFDSLHWFQSVSGKFETEKKRLNEESSAKTKAKGDDEDVRALAMTMRKVSHYKQEFDLLFYCFNGARIFFRD